MHDLKMTGCPLCSGRRKGLASGLSKLAPTAHRNVRGRATEIHACEGRGTMSSERIVGDVSHVLMPSVQRCGSTFSVRI